MLGHFVPRWADQLVDLHSNIEEAQRVTGYRCVHPRTQHPQPPLHAQVVTSEYPLMLAFWTPEASLVFTMQ
eukprot:12417780-Karenia_brevis.AAC.1